MAACPRDGCRNVEHHDGTATRLPPPLHEAGHACGLRRDEFRCSACGWRGPVAWPADLERIETLLVARPAPASRSWLLGEPVEHLLAENVEHGLVKVAG